MTSILVLNAGSSSLKYQLVQPDTGDSRAQGLIERIGEEGGVADYEAALRMLFDRIAADGLVAVGHRVVHGGSRFHRPTLIDDAVLAELRELSALAPLHNPPAILGIEVTPKQVGLCMVGVKISREVHEHKRDNLVDGAGYLKTVMMVEEEQERRANLNGFLVATT